MYKRVVGDVCALCRSGRKGMVISGYVERLRKF